MPNQMSCGLEESRKRETERERETETERERQRERHRQRQRQKQRVDTKSSICVSHWRALIIRPEGMSCAEEEPRTARHQQRGK